MWKIVLLAATLSVTQALRPLRGGHIDPSLAQPLPQNIPAERIVGGDEAAPGQFPHQVAIWIYEEEHHSQPDFFCGGSLISDKVVVTAAHCAIDGEKFKLVFGAHQVHDNKVVSITKNKVVHESYNPDNVENDIALLILPESIAFDELVQPIRLPSQKQAKNSFWRSEVTMSGWGLAHDGDQTVSDTLRYVKSRVVSNLYCRARFYFRYVEKTNICTSGWWAKGTCQGDSGGPLVIYEADKKPTLVGLTSFGVGYGCEKSWPSVFTRITSYLDWIETMVEKHVTA